MSRVPVSRAVFATVARVLQAGGVRVVFVGGATVPLRVDLVAANGRVTDDIDCVVDAVNYAEYAALLERLRALGFSDAPEEGVTCRMRLGSVVMDFMPRANLPLAPSSPFFERIWMEPDSLEVEPGLTIPVARIGDLFATKVEAFLDRGAADPYASKDLEDLVTLLDGRASLLDELDAARAEVRMAAGRWASWMTARRDGEDLVAAWFWGPDAERRAATVWALVKRLAAR